MGHKIRFQKQGLSSGDQIQRLAWTMRHICLVIANWENHVFLFFVTAMRGYICAILTLLFLTHTGHAQSYGLRFSSHEVEQEKRTSLNLTPSDDLCFKNDGEISFDLMFAQNMEIYFGYVFRLITADGQNMDLIYNQKFSNFNFIIGETVAGTFTIDSARLYNEWNHFIVRLNTKDHEILFYVNNKFAGKSKANVRPGLCFKMYFGTNNFAEFQTADIPPMSLKNIRINENGKTNYYWPLSEASGDDCFDSVQRKIARVNNPVWIRPRHQNWQMVSEFQVRGAPSVAFDPVKNCVFVVAEDSLYSLSLSKLQLSGEKWANGPEYLLQGNQSVYSPVTDRIYNIYIDQKKIRTYDARSRKWDISLSQGPATEFWQANKFLSYKDTSLYMVDGYGQLKYKNLVQRYSFPEKKWEIVSTKGDYFNPRYLSALGTNATGDTAYIMGGYGSTTGDQMANPKYYYDLMEYRVRDSSFKLVYHFKEPGTPFCFANSLIIDPDAKEYYALIYSNDKFNSRLQLINGSLVSPGYQLLGDEIPYSFHDIQSFADLYYCPDSKQLIAVTLYTSKENRTDIRVYTIAFPPNPIVAATPPVARGTKWIYLALITFAGLGLLLIAAMIRRRMTRSKTIALTGEHLVAKPIGTSIASAQKGSGSDPGYAHQTYLHEHPVWMPASGVPDERATIFFFGQFEVYDKVGHDLTKQFTPLLKELFLLIAIYTLRSGKGISSERLYATLWRDKSNKDAQNNRSVNMVKLKGILDKLGTCGIVKEADKWIFHYSPDQIRMDLAEFLGLVHIHQPAKEDISHFLGVILKGAFLADTTYLWLDDIQSEMSEKALGVLSAATIRFSSDPEFLLEIASGIFLFDPVNEEALKVKCKSLGILGRHSMAKSAFEKFAKEYHQMYGEEFQHSFQEIIG
jgi:DNA-binding SARP family transcriptional activator